jgi:cytochrome c
VQAAGYAEGELAGIINACIEKPLKGTALDPASGEMKSLIMYIRTFARQEK